MSDKKPFAEVVEEPAGWRVHVAGGAIGWPSSNSVTPRDMVAAINAAVEAREARLLGDIERLRDALIDVVDRHYSGRCLVKDEPCSDPACCSEGRFRSVLAQVGSEGGYVTGDVACGLAFDLGALQAKFDGTWGVLADKLHETNGAIDGQAAALLGALGIVSWKGLWRTLDEADLEGPLTMTGIDIRENSHGPLAPRLQWLDVAGEWHELGADNDGLVRPPPEAVQVRSVYRSRLQGDAIMPPSAPAEAAPRRPPSRRRKSAR